MSDRRERIPAEEALESKLWSLPYWTEPQHLVHAEEEAEEDTAVLIEEEEIEVKPFTAEQLESIRQEAYNEGLQQGMVEGRQIGEKQGYDNGHAEGLRVGKEEGKKQGYDEGFQLGEKAAIAEADNKNAELASRIQASMRNIESEVSDQKHAIESILPDLVIAISQAVVAAELEQGSEHIVNLVRLALQALPTDTKGLTIECNSKDLPYLEAAQENTDFDATFKVNAAIQPGGCKVNSRYSSVDFTLSERWQAVINQYQQQLQLGLNNIEEIQQQAHQDALATEAETNSSIEETENLQTSDALETNTSEETENLQASDALETNTSEETDVQQAKQTPAPDVSTEETENLQASDALETNTSEETDVQQAKQTPAPDVSTEETENLQARDALETKTSEETDVQQAKQTPAPDVSTEETENLQARDALETKTSEETDVQQTKLTPAPDVSTEETENLQASDALETNTSEETENLLASDALETKTSAETDVQQASQATAPDVSTEEMENLQTSDALESNSSVEKQVSADEDSKPFIPLTAKDSPAHKGDDDE